ncbi:TolC family protein [Prochlorococcus marinus]|uniref:TolC family protein n=1 Tax=Prochlorococcus TaxID=1218 RepID=UPI0007BC30DC|nr:TolC family protein [Prochlorococcus marinus]KZR72387.1 Outer membrane efflux protein [Prochlorococcus marinus str. MIT 1312]
MKVLPPFLWAQLPSKEMEQKRLTPVNKNKTKNTNNYLGVLEYLNEKVANTINVMRQGNSLALINSVTLITIFSYAVPANAALESYEEYQKAISWKPAKDSMALNINEVVKLAKEESPALKSQYLLLTSKEYSTLASQAGWFPALTLDMNWERIKGEENAYDPDTAAPSDKNVYKEKLYSSLAPSATIKWDLVDLARDADISMAFATEDQQYEATIKEEKDVISSAQKGYVTLQYAIASYYTSRVLSKNALDFYRAAEQLYTAGIATYYDVVKQKATLLDNVSNTVSAINDIKNAQNTLSSTIGLSPESPPIIPATSLDLLGEWKHTRNDSIRDAILSSNSLKESKAKTAYYNAYARYYISKYYPTLTLGLEVDPSRVSGNPSYSTTLNPGYQTDSWTVTLSASVGWEVFDGGINKSNSNAALFNAKSEEENYKDTLNQLISTIKNNYETINSYAFITENNVEEVKAAVDLLRMDLAALSLGKGSATNVVQDQSAIVSYMDKLLSNIQVYNNNLIEISSLTEKPIETMPKGKLIHPIKLLEPLELPIFQLN